jgi:DNA-binding NtrC family response regulator
LRSLYPEEQDSLELTIVSSVSTLLATLDIINPEVIFLDLTVANPDPLNAVRRVHRSAPAVPLIVLADGNDKDCALKSLSQGALCADRKLYSWQKITNRSARWRGKFS